MRTELSVVQPAVHVQSEWRELKLQKWRKHLKVHISEIYVYKKKVFLHKNFPFILLCLYLQKSDGLHYTTAEF